MTNVPVKRGKLDTDTHTARIVCEEEGEGYSDAAEAKKCQRWPATARSWREAWNTFLLSVSVGANPANNLISDFQPLDL